MSLPNNTTSIFKVFLLAPTIFAGVTLLNADTIQVDPNITYEINDGWEATGQYTNLQNDFFSSAGAYQKDAVARVAVNKLGLNRVRLELVIDAENPVDYFYQFESGQKNHFEWSSSKYSKLNDNNDPFVADPNGFHFTRIDFDVEAVILPMKRELEARGERLWLNLCFVDFAQGNPNLGYYSDISYADNPEEYAELALEAFKHLDSKYGIVPDSFEMILEPDKTVDWIEDKYNTSIPGSLHETGERIGNAIVATTNRLSAHGYNPQIIAPSVETIIRFPEIFDGILSVPGAIDELDVISYHTYAVDTPAARQAIIDAAQTHGKKTAMLERAKEPLSSLWDELTINRVSAFCRWALFGANVSAYLRPEANYNNPGNYEIALTENTWAHSQVFRYVRMGAVQIEATGGNAVAYINKNGSYVVVINNIDDYGPYTIDGLPAGTYQITSSGTTHPSFGNPSSSIPYVMHRAYPDITIAGGESLTFSVTTTNTTTKGKSHRGGLITVLQTAGANVDNTAPTVPQNFQSTAVSDAQIDLSWDAATDAGGISHYEIYRNGLLYMSDINGTSFSDTGLLSGVNYNYQVRSVDTVGNVSDLASALDIVTTANVPDTVLNYTNHGTHIEIVSCDLLASGGLAIPATLESLPVTLIAANAFNGCNQLNSIILPEGVTSIGDNAFESCTELRSVSLPSTLSQLGSYAFSDCPKLTAVTLPDAISQIEPYTFADCVQLENVQLPNNLTGIGAYAFKNCKRLSAVTLPSSITTIDSFAFRDCERLIILDLGASVSSLGTNPFASCDWLLEVNVDAGNPNFSSLNGVLYDKAMTEILCFPAGIARDPAPGLASTLTSIADYAFEDASSFDGDMIFPDTLSSIGDYAFKNSSNFSHIFFPESLSQIGIGAFEGCTDMARAQFEGDEPTMNEPVFSGYDPSFTVYYWASNSGFATPTWLSYSAIPMDFSSFSKWLTYNHLAHDLDRSTDLVDDGTSVLLDYSQNLSAAANNAGAMPQVDYNSPNLELDFYASAPGIDYIVEVSADMVNWTSSGVSVSAPDGNGRSVATSPHDAAFKFMRLRVVELPE